MTAREQLAEARERFCRAESQCAKSQRDELAEIYRAGAYRLWLEAVLRFNREQRLGPV